MTRKYFSIIYVTILLPLLATPVQAEEARCAELGQNCLCSEPLTFSATVDSNSFDPPDSPDATECGPADGPAGESLHINSYYTVDTVPGSSVGLPGVERVLRAKTPIFVGNLKHGVYTSVGGTICIRNYWSISDTPATQPTASLNFKIFADTGEDAAPGGSVGVSSTWSKGQHLYGTEGNSYYSWNPGSDIGKDGKGPNYTPVSWGQCTAPNWCYDERCYDHNLNGQNKVQFRGRFSVVGNPLAHAAGNYKKSISLNSQAAGMDTGEREMGSRLGCFNIDGITDHCPTYRYLSMHMVARKDVADENFWIGPAYEIEGGGGNSPDSTSPAAPANLSIGN